jgi:hypothetical protein
MAQLTPISDTVDAYDSEQGDENYNIEQSETQIYTTVANTYEAYHQYLSEVDLYFALTNVQNHLNTIINEVNARETATIDGGAF